MSTQLPTDYGPLRAQLTAAAEALTDDPGGLAELLTAMVDDVERAVGERLEIFPVCHHSPASALHMLQRLRARPPKLILMEGCEDLVEALPMLRDCSLPVSLQAFAGEAPDFPPQWSPLSLVMPLTEFSAEYQAIAFALDSPDCELIFVDRSTDHVFQWLPQEEEALQQALAPPSGDELDDEELPEATSMGLELGQLVPTVQEFVDVLLGNARVRHFQEWWSQYVEGAVLGADYHTYRQVFFLVASLLRRLGRSEEENQKNLRREAYMWTRIKQAIEARGLEPGDCLYICGAIHAVSPAPEFGIDSPHRAAISPRSSTEWLYGMVPTSYTAIERQFGHPRGTISLAEGTWRKACAALRLKPFALSKKPKKSRRSQRLVAGPPGPPPDTARLQSWLSQPPVLEQADEQQLLRWCVDVVSMARANGYLASTADAISIYEHAILLARMRNRRHPTPYDFQDAAVTCLEKGRVPRKRDIKRICEIMIGGDREGQVGYSSLPPLVQDVINRLKPLGLNLSARTVQRALVDYTRQPELLPCSELLWRIQYLLGPNRAVRPIMGEKVLGRAPVQESWDITLGKKEGQADIIPLAYEGVTVEQVLEKRLKARAFSARAEALDALEAAEAAETYLGIPRLVAELGERALHLLTDKTSAESAPEIFERVRRLVHYYRARPGGLPPWLQAFVTAGYQHYATLLPQAFEDRGTHPRQVAGMLSFLFTLESLALSLGCQRSQVLIALQQASDITTAPEKLGLLWASEWLVGTRDRQSIRAFFDSTLDNPLLLSAFPGYVAGFLLALGFAPAVAPLVVESLSKAFGRLPPSLLMPWLPSLIMTMRAYGGARMAPLIKEAARTFPSRLDKLDSWTPAWGVQPSPGPAPAPTLSAGERGACALLVAHPATADDLAARIGARGGWTRSPDSAAGGPAPPVLSVDERGARELLLTHRAATVAAASRIKASGEWTELLGEQPAAGGLAAFSPTEAGAAELLAARPTAGEALLERLRRRG